MVHMEHCAPQIGAFAIGDLIGGIMNPSENRWKVHPGSQRRGDEGRFYTRLHKRLRAKIMYAAEHDERVGQKANRLARNRRRNGPLGYTGLSVLRYMLRTVNAVTGQLDPSHDTIARETGHSVQGVHDALARLAKAGYIQWIRRYIETARRGRKGPQLEQSSNAYRITVPADVAATWKEAPLPSDELWRRKEERAEFAGMKKDPEFALFLAGAVASSNVIQRPVMEPT